jgi:HK97 family phage prohead protease
MSIERRFLATGGVGMTVTTARLAGDNIGTVEGYASVFDTLSHDLGGWRERIAPGAFATALRATDFPILALYDHTIGSVLGSTANGTLRLTEDTKGLRFALDLPDTSAGRDVLALVTRGDVAGASFGFTVSKRGSEWMKGTGGVPVKVVREVKALREISIVALPAYPAAYTMAAPTKPETPTQARCRQAVEKMRQAVAATG